MNLAAIIACTVLAWAVWERRWTLRSASEAGALLEQSITTGIALLGVGIFLLTPLSEATIGRALHALTGQWSLNAYVGHSCLIGTIASLGVGVFSRTGIPLDKMRAQFRRNVALPMTFTFPVALALFWQSPNAKTYWPDFLDCPTDHWLDAYWTLMCLLCMWLLARVTWVLIGLRRDPHNRPVACFYCLGCILGIILCGYRIYTTWADIDCREATWWAYTTIACLFGYSARQSWRRRVDWFSDREKTHS